MTPPKYSREPVDAALRRCMATRGVAGLELEFRLGGTSPTSKAFVPGVSRDKFALLESVLERSETFREVLPTTTTDFYFRGHDGRLEQDGAWLRKDRVLVADREGVRVTLAYETRGAAPAPECARAENAAFYRKKARRSWVWTELPWRIDLTRVQSNEDPDAEDYRFEAEIEMLPHAVYSVPLDVLLAAGQRIAADLANM